MANSHGDSHSVASDDHVGGTASNMYNSLSEYTLSPGEQIVPHEKRTLPNSPFSPGWGGIPPALAGRQKQKEVLVDHCDQLHDSGSNRAVVLVGPRGNGKTALINWLDNHSDTLGVVSEWLTPSDVPSIELLGERIAAKGSSLLPRVSALELSGKTGAFEKVLDISAEGKAKVSFGERAEAATPLLADLMVERASEKPYVMLVDEAHTLDPEVGCALLNAAQRAENQAPFLLVLAGTPNLESALNAMNTTFWTRARVLGVSLLPGAETQEALEGPLSENYIFLASDELRRKVIQETQGYPYFIQVCGDALWSVAREAPEEVQENRAVSPIILDGDAVDCALDRAFVDKRYYYARRRQELARLELLDSALTVAGLFDNRHRIHLDVLIAVVAKDVGDTGKAEQAIEELQRIGYVWTAPESPEQCEPAIPSLMDYVTSEQQKVKKQLQELQISSSQGPL